MRIRALLLAAALGLLTACGASLGNVIAQTQGRSIAVVSLSINDFGGSLQGWNQTRTSDLMQRHAVQMVGMVEERFANHWQVIPAYNFASNPDYLALAGPPREVAVPIWQGSLMPLFGNDRSDMVGARIPPHKVQALSQIIGADLIAVVYSEWGVKTGGFVPTSKALAKNVLSIYDAAGQQIYRGRKDVMGNQTLGAFGHVVVDENSIFEWVEAFDRGIAYLLAT